MFLCRLRSVEVLNDCKSLPLSFHPFQAMKKVRHLYFLVYQALALPRRAVSLAWHASEVDVRILRCVGVSLGNIMKMCALSMHAFVAVFDCNLRFCVMPVMSASTPMCFLWPLHQTRYQRILQTCKSCSPELCSTYI